MTSLDFKDSALPRTRTCLDDGRYTSQVWNCLQSGLTCTSHKGTSCVWTYGHRAQTSASHLSMTFLQALCHMSMSSQYMYVCTCRLDSYKYLIQVALYKSTLQVSHQLSSHRLSATACQLLIQTSISIEEVIFCLWSYVKTGKL